MKTMKFGTIGVMMFVLFGFHLAARFARGDAILVSDNRSISTSVFGARNSAASPAAPFADFSAAVWASNLNVGSYSIEAEQLSTITPSDFEAYGYAEAFFGGPQGSRPPFFGARADTLFDIGFTLLDPHFFQLIVQNPFDTYIEKTGGGRVILTPYTGLPTLTAGVLDPGSYVIHADWAASCSTNEFNRLCQNYDFYHLSFKLQTASFEDQDPLASFPILPEVQHPLQIPEPSTITLLSASLLLSLTAFIGLARTRRARVL